jgi:hypothetical protein
MIGLLTALPRTPLHARLAREGRLVANAANGDNTKLATNIVPKRMAYDDMLAAYKALFHRLLTDRQIAERIRNKLHHLRNPARQNQYRLGEGLTIIGRLIARGILPGGWTRLRHFLRSLPVTSPRLLPQAITDWILGLSMRDYTERRFGGDTNRVRTIASTLFASMQVALAAYQQSGKVTVALNVDPAPAPNIFVSFEGWLDRRFFSRTARHLERLLMRTPSTLTLRIGAVPAATTYHLDRLLKRLSPYGDRISICIDKSMRKLVPIDSSVFHLVLD